MASPSLKGSEELINHYGLVRIRANGSANLQLTLFSLDEVESFVLAPIVLQSATNIEPTELSNFTEQRAKLEGRTININEIFKISKIIIYAKPIANSYPM